MLRRALFPARRPFSFIRPSKALWGEPTEVKDGMVELTVNGEDVRVPAGTTIMQAASLIGVDIPRFCYHERLKIAGNCRMCLVQVNGGAKLTASCAAPVAAQMKVETESAPVKKAREGVMEFLLANHPLDCPICDQGGECDLQEQAMAFGSDRSRFRIDEEDKRAVRDKDFGPLVKTSMNRCIHCTRCVRFAVELAGADELGTTGRGSAMEIGTYVEKSLGTELSGNVVDLCPVGALTAKPHAYAARPWELRKTETVDVMDAMGSSIRVDSRGPQVIRVLPRLNEAINEEWLGDKSRFACDGLRYQRLTKPLIRQHLSNGESVLRETEWEAALLTAATQLRSTAPEAIEAISGPSVDMETLFLTKSLLQELGSWQMYFDGRSLNASSLPFGPATRFNPGIAGIEQADAILLVGTWPRWEAPLLNARIRKAYIQASDAPNIGLVGEIAQPKKGLTYPFDHLGSTIADLQSFKNSSFWERFKAAKRPALIVGQSVYDAGASHAVLDLVRDVPNLQSEGWNGFGYLPLQASRTGALALGWSAPAARKAKSSFTFLVGADDISKEDLSPNAFVLYQGSHGDRGALLADIVLPGAAYTEKSASWMNMEGKMQRSRPAVPPPGDARPDWQIVRALAEVVGVPLPYDTEGAVFEAMQRSLVSDTSLEAALNKTGFAADASTILRSPISDYYLTDSISRASPTMAACSRHFMQV